MKIQDHVWFDDSQNFNEPECRELAIRYVASYGQGPFVVSHVEGRGLDTKIQIKDSHGVVINGGSSPHALWAAEWFTTQDPGETNTAPSRDAEIRSATTTAGTSSGRNFYPGKIPKSFFQISW